FEGIVDKVVRPKERRVIHQNVQAAELAPRRAHKPLRCLCFSNIGGDRNRFSSAAADASHSLLELMNGSIIDHDDRTFVSEQFGYSPTDTAATARHQGYFVSETHGIPDLNSR